MECSYGEILATLAARPSGRGWDGCCPLAHRHKNGDRNPSLRLWVGERGELVARCYGCGATWNEIVAATGTAPCHWWPEPLAENPQQRRRRRMGRITAVYPYRDADGLEYAQKVRREPGSDGRSKSFSWRRSLPPSLRDKYGIGPGEEAWVWGSTETHYAPHNGDVRDWRMVHLDPAPENAVEFPGIDPCLYRLPELNANPMDAPVCVVEGEKKANILYALGLCAVCGPHGAGQWNHAWGVLFAGRKVVVIPDNNAPGLAHAGQVAGSLLLHGVAALKIILPGENWDVGDDQDIADWLKKIPARDQRKELAALFRRFPAYGTVAAPPVKGAA